MQKKLSLINKKKSLLPAIMILVLSFLAFTVSLISVFNKGVYTVVLSAGTISETLLNGAIAQDIITIPLALTLLSLSIHYLKKPVDKVFISIIGLTTYLLYAYGLFVIEAIYTSFYPVYLLIFGLSVYSLIFGFSSFRMEVVKQSQLPGIVSTSIAVFLIIIVVILGPGWLLKMIPNVIKHAPKDTYSVFILDLCLVFPAFVITSFKLLKNKPFGHILAGVMLIKVFTVCLSWGFGEWFVLFNNKPVNYPMAVISSTLTVISIILFIIYIINLRNVTK